jgi:5-methylthioribose kinase
MYNGAIITFESDLEMNRKPHSKQIEDYMNPLSCSSECVIFQQPSYDGRDFQKGD